MQHLLLPADDTAKQWSFESSVHTARAIDLVSLQALTLELQGAELALSSLDRPLRGFASRDVIQTSQTQRIALCLQVTLPNSGPLKAAGLNPLLLFIFTASLNTLQGTWIIPSIRVSCQPSQIPLTATV